MKEMPAKAQAQGGETLFVTYLPFWEKRAGSHVRTWQAYKQLGDGKILFLGRKRKLKRLPPELSSKLVVADAGVFSRSWMKMMSLPREIVGKLSEWLSMTPGMWVYELPLYASQFIDALNRVRPNVVYLSYIRLSWLIPIAHRVLPGVHCIVDTHDVISMRYGTHVRQGRRHWVKLSESQEVQRLAQADLVWAISEHDHQWFSERGITSSYVPVTLKHELAATPSDNPGFIASDNEANRHTLESIRLAWRSARLNFEGRQLVIAGSICHRLQAEPGEALLGEVDDVAEFYEQIGLLVNPVSIGGGVKIKNLEALSFGCPVLTTAVGSEGMDSALQAKAIVLCDAPFELENLTRALQNLKQLQQNARTYHQTMA